MRYNGQKVNLERVICLIKEAKTKGIHTRLLLNPYNPLVGHLDLLNHNIETVTLEYLTKKTELAISQAVDELCVGRFW